MGNPDDSAWGEPYVPPTPVEPLTYQSVSETARYASFFIGMWAIIALIGLYIDFSILVAIGHSIADTPTLTKAEIESLASQESVLAILAMSAYAASAIFFLRWTYLAANNAHVLSPVKLRFSRASAVWWWFIPFMNFWKPYQVMSEIWNASSGAVSTDANEPAMPRIVAVWWASTIVAIVLALWGGSRMMSLEGADQAQMIYQLKLLARAVGLTGGLILVLLIKRLTALQTTRAPIPALESAQVIEGAR